MIDLAKCKQNFRVSARVRSVEREREIWRREETGKRRNRRNGGVGAAGLAGTGRRGGECGGRQRGEAGGESAFGGEF